MALYQMVISILIRAKTALHFNQIIASSFNTWFMRDIVLKR